MFNQIRFVRHDRLRGSIGIVQTHIGIITPNIVIIKPIMGLLILLEARFTLVNVLRNMIYINVYIYIYIYYKNQ